MCADLSIPKYPNTSEYRSSPGRPVSPVRIAGNRCHRRAGGVMALLAWSPPGWLRACLPGSNGGSVGPRARNSRFQGAGRHTILLLLGSSGGESAAVADRPRPETPRRIPTPLTEAVGSGVPTPRSRVQVVALLFCGRGQPTGQALRHGLGERVDIRGRGRRESYETQAGSRRLDAARTFRPLGSFHAATPGNE